LKFEKDTAFTAEENIDSSKNAANEYDEEEANSF
jgi:hypothetical protein